jgi:FMN-dependent NADH-azoreductase
MTLLHVNCCISPNDEPRTAKLAAAFTDAYAASHPDARIEEYALDTSGLLPLVTNTLRAREALASAGETGAPEFAPARQFAAADRIVVSAPYWELSFPSMLKVYVENISMLGITFAYNPDGSQRGLCRAKRMLYLTCSGGPIGKRDFGAEYMRAMCGVFGIPEFISVAAENQDVAGGDGAMRLDAAVGRARGLAPDF